MSDDDMSRNFSNCHPDSLRLQDLPNGWRDNETRLCGISWPSATPFTNLSACCVGPVQVSNGCWQYCATNLSDFINCAYDQISNFSVGGSFCNRDVNGVSTSGASADITSYGTVAALAMLWLIMFRRFL
ncbi:hypothetical protein NU195Hw_g52t1 [Hortaea werneckii]